MPMQANLPLGEWAHVALVWAPYRGDPERTISYVYVNGRDANFYRSFNWAGYSSPRASSGAKVAKGLEEFISKAIPGARFAIDELRISKVARYADLKIEFGPQQTFNPVRFQPPAEPFQADGDTVLLLHFDGDLNASVPKRPLAARLVE